MDTESEPGFFLSLSDCAVLFPKLKTNESLLSREERNVLLRIEKVLYGNLSVEEMEGLLEQKQTRFFTGSGNA